MLGDMHRKQMRATQMLLASAMALSAVVCSALAHSESQGQGTKGQETKGQGTKGQGRSNAQSPETLVISGLGEGAVPIDGPWEFHTGDDPAWASPAWDDSSWERLSAGRPWGQQGHGGYSGLAWYRRHLDLRSAAPEAANFELLLPEVDEAYEVYWNGALIGRCGALPPHPVWYTQQRPHVFALNGDSAGVLAVRVWNAPPLSDEDPGLLGGFVVMPLVGTPGAIVNAKAALNYSWLRSQQFVFTENLVYALVALLSFLVWLRNREHWFLLWMTGFTLSPVLTLLLLRCRLPIPYTIAMSLDQPLISLRDISLWFLLLWLLELHSDERLARFTGRLAGFSFLLNAVDGILVAVASRPHLQRVAQTGDALMTVLDTVLEMYPLVLVGLAAARRKRLNAANVAVAIAAFLVEMVYVIRDVAGQGKRFTHWQLTQQMESPILVLNGSAVSLVDALEVVLFLCAVWAVYRSFFEERKRQLEIDQELKSARELQRVLVPDSAVALTGFRITSAYRPAQQVGGDFFQVLPIGDASLVVVGDVSGKGLRAAMSVSFLLGVLRTLVAAVPGPAELLRDLNQRIFGSLQGGFTTCLVLEVERDGRCRVASAGHPPPFIDGRELDLEGALPLGLFADVEYRETSFHLLPGQTCAIYTDGVLEARNQSGELYGFSRLSELFAGRPSAEQAAEAAMEFGQDDDITIVSITRLWEADAPAQREGELALGAGETAVTG